MIKVEFYQKLAEVVNDPICRLEVLDFEANKMGDSIVMLLCSWLKDSPYIKVLNLSKNEITDKAVPSICTVLDQCTDLKGLYLHYNRILSSGGNMLAQSLRTNKFLEVFDISFNSIGAGVVTADIEKSMNVKDTVAKLWSDCFRFNQSLIHVDISHNNLRQLELETIAEGLRANHVILGLHLLGNEGEIDANGFMRQNEAITFGSIARS